MTIAVKRCSAFNKVKIDSMLFFDMGSICAKVKSFSRNLVEAETQNEGWIYENQTLIFAESKHKKRQ